MCVMVTDGGATPRMVMSSKPWGGKSRPICMQMRNSTPNHTGSMPRAFTIGMKIGIEPVPTSGLLITICGGTSITQRTEVVQSRATGWFYENGTTETSQTYYGVGLVYQPDNTNWALFAQFDRRRGGEIGYHMEL